MTLRLDVNVPIRDFKVDKQTQFLYVYRVPIAGAMVQKYTKNDGSTDMEAKLPEEILSDSTVASANGKPVTDNHPGGLVTKDNAKKLMVGFTGSNAHVEDGYIYNDIVVTDADMIDKIQNGQRELSIGFETEVEPQSGVYQGKRYDSVQRNIRINHVAVVYKGRAGHKVRLLGDSAEAVDEGESMETKTTSVRIDGINGTVTVADSDVDKITKLDADNSAKQKKIENLNAQIAQLTKERDALKGDAKEAKDKADQAEAKADSAEADKEKLQKEFDAFKTDGLDKRVDLISKVTKFVGDSDYDYHNKTERDLKIDAIKSVKGDAIDLDDKNDEYINAAFDLLGEPKKKHHINGYGGQQTKGDADDPVAKAMYKLNHMYEGGK